MEENAQIQNGGDETLLISILRSNNLYGLL